MDRRTFVKRSSPLPVFGYMAGQTACEKLWAKPAAIRPTICTRASA